MDLAKKGEIMIASNSAEDELAYDDQNATKFTFDTHFDAGASATAGSVSRLQELTRPKCATLGARRVAGWDIRAAKPSPLHRSGRRRHPLLLRDAPKPKRSVPGGEPRTGSRAQTCRRGAGSNARSRNHRGSAGRSATGCGRAARGGENNAEARKRH